MLITRSNYLLILKLTQFPVENTALLPFQRNGTDYTQSQGFAILLGEESAHAGEVAQHPG